MSPPPGQNQTDQPLFLGIDAGTSGIRACLIDPQARPVAEASHPLPAPDVSVNQISQDPQIWADVLDTVLKKLTATTSLQNLKSIAIDGTSGSVLFADAQGHPTSKALMYNDACAQEQVKQLQTLTDNTVVQTVSAGLPKLMWLLKYEGEYEEPPARYAMHQADYLGFLLTGLAGHSDVNNCLKTGYDPFSKKWPDWFQRIPEIQARLPRVHPPGTVIAPVSADAVSKYGFSASTQLVAGTTDSHAAILATDIQQVGDAVTSLGSTLVVKVISDKPIFDERYGIYSQPFGEHWLVGGGSNSGGAVLRNYFTDEQMTDLSKKIDPQHDTGLDYYPLNSSGERFPINDPEYAPRLTPRPDDDVKFFQALLEGIARIEHQAYQRLAELGAPYPTSIRTVGGGARNKVWTEMRSRYCQTEIVQSEYTEAAYGSALLAMHGYAKQRSQ